jgi:hypothetical protein
LARPQTLTNLTKSFINLGKSRQNTNRLNSPAQARSYDTSGDGRGNDYIVGEAVEQPEEQVGVPIERSEDEQGVRHIRKMSMKMFRSKLIEHFNILKDRGNLCWPKAKKRT